MGYKNEIYIFTTHSSLDELHMWQSSVGWGNGLDVILYDGISINDGPGNNIDSVILPDDQVYVVWTEGADAWQCNSTIDNFVPANTECFEFDDNVDVARAVKFAESCNKMYEYTFASNLTDKLVCFNA